MNPISTLTVSCVLLSSTLATLTSAKRFSKEKDAVLLENIKALTFQDGKDTTHRRVSALPQVGLLAFHRQFSNRTSEKGDIVFTSKDIKKAT